MPTWLTIVIAVSSALLGIGGGIGLSTYMSERMKHRAIRNNLKEDKKLEELENARQEANLKQLTSAVEAVVLPLFAPLSKDVAEIKKDLQNNTKGTVTILRNDMKKSLDYCKRQGYASASDRAN